MQYLKKKKKKRKTKYNLTIRNYMDITQSGNTGSALAVNSVILYSNTHTLAKPQDSYHSMY
jgi:hypothetical protein